MISWLVHWGEKIQKVTVGAMVGPAALCCGGFLDIMGNLFRKLDQCEMTHNCLTNLDRKLPIALDHRGLAKAWKGRQ